MNMNMDMNNINMQIINMERYMDTDMVIDNIDMDMYIDLGNMQKYANKVIYLYGLNSISSNRARKK
jgi:hypothetical protein